MENVSPLVDLALVNNLEG